MRARYAVVASVLLVAGAIGVGLLAARLGAPPPPAPATALPSPPPSPPADTGPLVFRQPLAAGCPTADAVWVVADGGGIGRFDGERWQLIDPTLRSLVAAACRGDVMVAVGPAGRIVTVDDVARTVRVDTVTFEDLLGVSAFGDGAMAVGSQGTVMLEGPDGWSVYARGIEEDLHAIAAFARLSAWAVGAGGVAYRLEEAGWRPVATGVSATLRAVAGSSIGDVVAAGDEGTLLRFDGSWKPVASGVTVALRAAARVGSVTYVAGDRGTVLVIEGAAVRRDDLPTTCTLRAAFARGGDVWFVGSEGTRSGVWRRTGDRLVQWGEC